MIRLPLISCFALLAIAACSTRSPVDAQAKGTAALPAVGAAAPSASGESHGATRPTRTASASSVKIPASLQGRWALSPNDCSAQSSAAKGLLVVTADDLHFAESTAVPATEVGAGATAISGNFAFNGDGRSWTKYEALKFANNRLTRTEINPTASFSYAKCS